MYVPLMNSLGQSISLGFALKLGTGGNEEVKLIISLKGYILVKVWPGLFERWICSYPPIK